MLGAPPGYVGYEAGASLLMLLKTILSPFALDEIEKAHPSILDKFLQILEDGRMTDGQGNTVYFSETIIIFTSNLGIYGVDSTGERTLRVTPQMSYEEVQKSVRKGIEEYFKLQLGRPEILNRIGENIVVFDFIREDIANEILKAQVNKIIRNLQSEKNITLSLSDAAMEVLRVKAVGNLDNGGRGIGNIVESLLINPLSRYLFDNEIFENRTVAIEDINAEVQPYSVNCMVV
ncbi:MAG: AAA family ATPase [Lachnospiraceae bacterium]